MPNIQFSPSTESDLNQIQKWTDADVYHRGQHNPEWWLTGEGFLSFCARDEIGSLFYVRIDREEGYHRLSVQFAPLEEVGKRRLILGMIDVMAKLIEVAKADKARGFVFDSESPKLIRFMSRYGFKDESGSFKLTFPVVGE